MITDSDLELKKSRSRREAKVALSQMLKSENVIPQNLEFSDLLFHPIDSFFDNKEINVHDEIIHEQESENLERFYDSEQVRTIEDEEDIPNLNTNCLENSSEKEESKIKLKSTSGLFVLLKKLFTGENTEDLDFFLSSIEKQILAALISRKFDQSLKSVLSIAHLKQSIDKIFESQGNKRPEENYKFAFKRVLKVMKSNFKKTHPPKTNSHRRNHEKAFYEFYFKSIAEKKKIPIESFFHPRTSRPQNRNQQKTINSEYIKAISESRPFIQKFSEHLSVLAEDSKALIESKIFGLLGQFENYLQDFPTEGVKKITEYVTKNKKCKLPWTTKEIGDAVKVVEDLFSKNVQ